MGEIRESSNVELDSSFADLSDDDFPDLESELGSSEDDEEGDTELDTNEAPGEEAPAPKADQPKKPAQPKVDAKGNLHRPEDGKFHPKGTDTAAGETAGQQPDEGQGDEQLNPGTDSDPAPAREEFTFRGDKKAFKFPGSQVDDEWIHIPRSHEQDLRTLLGEGVAHQGSFRQQLSSISQRATAAERRAVEAEAEAVKARTFLNRLYGMRKQGPEVIADWLDQLDSNFPKLEAEAILAQAKHLKENLSKLGREDAPAGDDRAERGQRQGAGYEYDDSVLIPNLVDNFRDMIDAEPSLRILDDQDLRDIAESVDLTQFFAVAEDDNPDAGYVRGDVLIRSARARERLQKEAARKRRLLGQREGADKARQANERRLGTGAAPTPPSVAGKGSAGGKAPPPKGSVPKLPKLGDKASFDRWMELPIEQQIASKEAGIREE